MDFFDAVLVDVQFRLAALRALDLLDIVLVVAVFYAILSFMRRTAAGALIRGILLAMLALLIVNLVLPLPTLDWLLTGVVLTLLIATPITLQPELRRALEMLGRNPLTMRGVRRKSAEIIAQPVRRAVRKLAEQTMGAIIILEGNDSLESIVKTGVRVNAEPSDELLRSIFYDKNPLHDGAVIIQSRQLTAAGCVLPLTEQELTSYDRRMGTRHRAAVGISEFSDALAIVVSEETGNMSVARRGRLRHAISIAELNQAIIDFYTLVEREATDEHKRVRFWQRVWTLLYDFFVRLVYLGFAIVLALLAWAVVLEQRNPLEHVTVTNIPLRVQPLNGDLTLFNTPPDQVLVEVRTTADVARSLNADSFQASVALDELMAGLHRVPIELASSINDLQILSVSPADVDVELVAVVTRTVPIVVEATNQQNLSVVFEMLGAPSAETQTAVIEGPEPLVVQVAQLYGTISVANATESLRRTVELTPQDITGQDVEGILSSPNQAQVSVLIRRRLDVREVNVRAVTTGTPPDGYWMSSLSVEPASVTLQGDPDLLSTHPSFINTLSVDVSATFGELEAVIPLDVPLGMQVFDVDGERVEQVTVEVQVSARQGDLLVNRPISLLNATDNLTITLQSAEVDLLLSGDLPTLREIEQNPELVQVMIDINSVPRNVPTDLFPEIVRPEGVRFQLINAPILIEVQE